MAKQKAVIDKIGEEILRSFHFQFAENQRTREQSFLKILGFLGAVVAAYAYVYQNQSLGVVIFSLATIAAVVLLTFGSAIVAVIAYNFRRDQYINARIRRLAGIIGKGKIFPSEYDPSHLYDKKMNVRFWMPDIFNVFFMVFPIFQILLIVSFLAKTRLELVEFSRIEWFSTFAVFVSLLALFFSMGCYVYYGRKLRGKIKKWEAEQ